MYRPIPPQLIDAFNNSVSPFDKDVVLVDTVRQWLDDQAQVYSSKTMVALWLKRPPFNGRGIQFWNGHTTQRAILLRGKWLAASGRAIMEYLASERDPLCD